VGNFGTLGDTSGVVLRVFDLVCESVLVGLFSA
jgi:hypothetical protein